MAKQFTMKPINPVIWVMQGCYSIIAPENITIEKVGEKAFGLTSLPAEWTLPFFVISDALFDNYIEEQNFDKLAERWERSVNEAALHCGINMYDDVIIRSNSHVEGLTERGKYISVEGSFSEWADLVKRCFDDAVKQENSNDLHMPIIIQKRITPLSSGHISNERRVAEEKRDWKGEIESTIPQTFSVSLRDWRKRINVNHFLSLPLTCPGDKVIKQVLSIPCAWATKQNLRLHFEWIYDGSQIYIVQADTEMEADGIDPKKVFHSVSPKADISDSSFPYCLHRLKAADAEKYKDYAKIQNPLLYQRIGLDSVPLYILDDAVTLEALAKGEVTEALERDLEILTAQSLIIRTDVAAKTKDERQMLPRTDDIQDVEEAKSWLCDKYSELLSDSSNKPIFILHNYIPALASAFAYSNPGDAIVRIEGLWGLPEGLYYYSHDKYRVNTHDAVIDKIAIDNFTVETKINYKKYFVCPMANGKWEVQTLAKPYDWASSVPDEAWIKEIAYITRRIAENEQKSVSVMWFVGVDNKLYSCNVIPWFHEPYVYSPEKTTPRNKLSFERTCVIHTLQEVEHFERHISEYQGTVRNIQIRPTDARILRDRKIVKRIGEIAKSIGANILLEGSILSHAYYELVRTGAQVEVRDPFEKTNNQKFNKLVRDNIPQKIEKNGEQAVTIQLEKEILAMLLKRKLVEEALEVLDTENSDDLLIEIADVLEVIDGILSQFKISMKDVMEVKNKKRKKAGGFEKGIFLKSTSASSEGDIGKVIIDSKPPDIKQSLEKSTDLRKYAALNETITRIKVPVTMDRWEVRPSIKNDDFNIIAKGERKQGTWQIEISVYEKAKQLSIFDMLYDMLYI